MLESLCKQASYFLIWHCHLVSSVLSTIQFCDTYTVGTFSCRTFAATSSPEDNQLGRTNVRFWVDRTILRPIRIGWHLWMTNTCILTLSQSHTHARTRTHTLRTASLGLLKMSCLKKRESSVLKLHCDLAGGPQLTPKRKKKSQAHYYLSSTPNLQQIVRLEPKRYLTGSFFH